MKKTLIAIMLVTATSIISAQTTMPNPNPFPKTITVSGSAEMEIIPDEIYVNITLREYQKRGETKKEIEARAYQLWEKAGQPAGREDEFWYLAQQELRNEDKSSPMRTPDTL